MPSGTNCLLFEGISIIWSLIMMLCGFIRVWLLHTADAKLLRRDGEGYRHRSGAPPDQPFNQIWCPLLSSFKFTLRGINCPSIQPSSTQHRQLSSCWSSQTDTMILLYSHSKSNSILTELFSHIWYKYSSCLLFQCLVRFTLFVTWLHVNKSCFF